MALSRHEIHEFLTENFGLDSQLLDENVPLFSSALLDSTSLVALVIFNVERTGHAIEGADLTLDNFDTIGHILTFCNARSV